MEVLELEWCRWSSQLCARPLQWLQEKFTRLISEAIKQVSKA